MRARKSLGQNFLVDPNLQRKIVDAVRADAAGEVLEIGPGTGALTRHLLERWPRLVAIELDERCVALLREELGEVEGFRLVHGDVLEARLEDLVDDVPSLHVVGNIPYNITSPILGWLLDRSSRPADIVLMVQKEVADRLLADPGSGDYGALTVNVTAVATVERLFNVGRRAFRPAPDVDSTVLRITPLRPAPLTPAEETDLRALTRAAFSWRRKQLQKTLRSAPEYGLAPEAVEDVAAGAGIDARARPETLTPPEFIRLAGLLRSLDPPRPLRS